MLNFRNSSKKLISQITYGVPFIGRQQSTLSVHSSVYNPVPVIQHGKEFVRCKSTGLFTHPTIVTEDDPNVRHMSTILHNSSTHNFALKIPEIMQFLEINAGKNGIAIVGNQSAGKTSLVEALLGLPGLFQKYAGAATKRPQRIKLIKTNDDIVYGRVGGSFGQKISNMEQLSRQIANKNDGDFDDEPFDITFWGPHFPEGLVFTDFPGDFSSVTRDQDPELPNIVSAMNTPAINDPDTHTVVVMAAGDDLRVCKAIGKVDQADQLGNATGVVTKCDTVDPSQLPAILKHKHYTQMGMMFYGVKLRSAVDNDAGMSIEESLESEQKFWQGIDGYKWEDKDGKHQFNLAEYQTGVPTVSKRMEDMLIKSSLHLIPKVKSSLETKENKLNSTLEMFETMNKQSDLTDQISRSTLQLVYKFGDNSPHRPVIERRIQDNMKTHIGKALNEVAGRPELFGEIRPAYEEFAVIQNMPENGYFSGNMLQHLRSVVNNNYVAGTTTEDAERWFKTHEYGKFFVQITNEEIQQSYNAHIAQQIPTAFFRFNLTEQSTLRKEDWFDKQRILIDVLLNEYNLAEELTSIATRTLHDSLYEFRPKNTDDRSWQLFEYIFDEVASTTNNEALTNTIRHTIDSIKSARMSPDRLAYHVMNASYNKGSSWNKSVGVLDTEMYPREYSIYGDVWIDAALKCMIEEMAENTHSIINNGLSQPLVENTVSRAFKHFEKTDKAADSRRVKQELIKVREYQNLVESLEEEAELIKHREEIQAEKIANLREEMDKKREAAAERRQRRKGKQRMSRRGRTSYDEPSDQQYSY